MSRRRDASRKVTLRHRSREISHLTGTTSEKAVKPVREVVHATIAA
jgi:hypothetical protein